MLRCLFGLPNLEITYRNSEKSFTRNRKLTFLIVCFLILQKTSKSLQIKLNEFFDFDPSRTVTASAYSQARLNLSHKIFIDFNNLSYAQEYYTGDYKTYKGYRLLAIDGTKVRLPESEEIREEFGKIKVKNQSETSSYTGTQSSVLFDVLNEIAIDSHIGHSRSSERDLAEGHIKGFSKEGDLILLDRGYSGYELFSTILSQGADFVCRCSSNAFKVVEEFIADEKAQDRIVSLKPKRELNSKVSSGDLPSELRIRLVKVKLSSGEIEVLATSLIDRVQHSTESFKELYFMRWGVETYYDRIKNRLDLENFTGKSVESVKQDFYSTILVSNVESELAMEANDELSGKEGNKNAQKVNKAVSFNAVKHHVIELLITSDDDEDVLKNKLREILFATPVPIRKDRSFSRKTTPRRQTHHHKRRRKSIY